MNATRRFLVALVAPVLRPLLAVALSASCAHEALWQPSARTPQTINERAADRATDSDSPTLVAACARADLIERWRGAASDERLCSLLPRVRSQITTVASDLRAIVAATTRLRLRRIAEKCRSDLRLSHDAAGRHARSTVRVLLDARGDIVLAASAAPLERSEFTECVVAAINAEASASTSGELYDVVVPPVPLRWWHDPRSPGSSQGLVW